MSFKVIFRHYFRQIMVSKPIIFYRNKVRGRASLAFPFPKKKRFCSARMVAPRIKTFSFWERKGERSEPFRTSEARPFPKRKGFSGGYYPSGTVCAVLELLLWELEIIIRIPRFLQKLN